MKDPVHVSWEELVDTPEYGHTLYASIEVEGVTVHLTAIEVLEGPPPQLVQFAAHPVWDRDLEYMQEEANGALQTFKHKFSDGETRTMTVIPSTGAA